MTSSAGYGGTTVLRDVTSPCPPASVVALLGANGAGKTHPAAGRLGAAAPEARVRPPRRRGRHRRAGAPARRRRRLPRPRGPGRLPAAHGPGEPARSSPAGARKRRPSTGPSTPSRASASGSPAGRDPERRRAADARPRPGLRVSNRASCCSTRCRWAWPPRSSTRSSTSSSSWRGEGVSLLRRRAVRHQGPGHRRLRLPAGPRPAGLRGGSPRGGRDGPGRRLPRSGNRSDLSCPRLPPLFAAPATTGRDGCLLPSR